MAADRTPFAMQSGLRIANEASPKYHRDKPNDRFLDDCLRIYHRLGHRHPAETVLFVNSMVNASRILKDLEGTSGFKLKLGQRAHVKGLCPGLVAMELRNGPLVEEARRRAIVLGTRPSATEVSKNARRLIFSSVASPRPLEDVNSPAALRDLFENGGNAIATLKHMAGDQAMQATAHCAASLLEGLKKTISAKIDTPELKRDPVVANALHALAHIVRALPTLVGDSIRFGAGYSALMEEMYLVLAVARPYEGSDFKKAAAAMLEERVGSALAHPSVASPETYLFSSGMEAISMGVEVARTLSGTKNVRFLANQERSPDYYETEMLVSHQAGCSKDRIRMASLGSNLPGQRGADDTGNQWNATKLLRQIWHWLGQHRLDAKHPAVLVLDITIEQSGPDGTSDLARVLRALAPLVRNGMLKIVLCKSYQKYTSVGSAKIVAGGVAVIGKDDARMQAAAATLRKAEKDLDWMRNDESQLLTHFLMHAHASELQMIDRAAKNASFVARSCLGGVRHPGSFYFQHEQGLPFLVTDAGERRVRVAKKSPQQYSAGSLLSRQVAPRDSFGFVLTSIAHIPQNHQVRIAFGQETREELVEKLYAFGWIAQSDLTELTPFGMAEKAMQIASEAAQLVLVHTDVTSWASAALHVLRERAERGDLASTAAIPECEALLTDGLRQEVLRQKLKGALDASAPRSGQVQAGSQAREHDARRFRLLSEELRIVGSAFAPRLPKEALRANDVDVMRQALREDHAASTSMMSDAVMRARYAPNAIASMLAMAGLGFGPTEVAGEHRAELESFYRAVLASGLPNVSPSTREHILNDWSPLQAQAIESAAGPAAQRAAVEELIRHARLAPYRETRAKMLVALSDRSFEGLEKSLQGRLVDTFFGPLDVTARLELIRKLASGVDVAKLGGCLQRFGNDLKEVDEGAPSLLLPDALSGGIGNAKDRPRTMTPDKVAELRKEILLAVLLDGDTRRKGLADRMASWASWICNDASAASFVAQIVRAYDTTPGVDFSWPDARRQALLRQSEMLREPYREVMELYLNRSKGRGV